MKRLFRLTIQSILAVFGIPLALVRVAQVEGRLLYVRMRYRKVEFGPGCNADDACEFGERVKVYGGTTLSRCKIGSYTYVGGQCVLQYCTIGAYCSIAENVRVGMGIHPVYTVISTFPGFYSRNRTTINYQEVPEMDEYKLTIVGNDVWIGARAMIMDGVNVGDGAVVAAGSVVTKDVAPYTVVGGVPAKLIRRRFTEEQAADLIEFAWWNRGPEFCRENAGLFVKPTEFLQMLRRKRDQNQNVDDIPR